ncbi:exopolysaccharide biosynthesis protein, WecB/TagA/CpsF family [Desulfocapsa sulfexigens DSM 10523]|uniref:Exopolysaccharide biosynthesis protein, WecB/TagA/CpsF family n=1 Tax=Desulfocapsa sulfexigens (strain DSM 10523 / SB164P1) TaxID=1167006 RepID=M1P9M1_DESSD|nr:WecB/TagA/CpsF family glycosyltransferase [Desulfocapsa sulfexigens]AGF78352.1 exopolysaccharide biosynthesis protein, WecB/TagA/CpsF family [Desulfocapsa sulfexigens DSM 10523]
MRYPILNIWTDAVSMAEALQKVSDFVDHGDRPHTIFATNPEKNFSVPADPFLYNCFKNADLLLPDGIGMVLGAKILHGAQISRVPGCEFMQETCALSARQGYKIFIYGAKEEVNKKAVEILEERLPGLQVAGRCNGYWPEDQMDMLVDKINESKAVILFLALGSPKQEKWFARHQDKLKHIRVCQGIGGTLDVITGTVKRAPEIFCKLGLEWFYRLLAEPRRIKRQMVLPVFAWQIFMTKIGFRK